MADMNHTGSQEDIISDWQPGVEIAEAPCLMPLAVVYLPVSLQTEGGPLAGSLLSLVFPRVQSFVL